MFYMFSSQASTNLAPPLYHGKGSKVPSLGWQSSQTIGWQTQNVQAEVIMQTMSIIDTFFKQATSLSFFQCCILPFSFGFVVIFWPIKIRTRMRNIMSHPVASVMITTHFSVIQSSSPWISSLLHANSFARYEQLMPSFNWSSFSESVILFFFHQNFDHKRFLLTKPNYLFQCAKLLLWNWWSVYFPPLTSRRIIITCCMRPRNCTINLVAQASSIQHPNWALR